MAGISFEVKEQICILSHSTKGWSKQLNLVSWNGRDAKYDIRDWDENHEKMGRGVSLSRDELGQLRNCLVGLDFAQSDDEHANDETLVELN